MLSTYYITHSGMFTWEVTERVATLDECILVYKVATTINVDPFRINVDKAKLIQL